MAGHSHAKTVRKTKEANAKKRSQIFAKIARLILVAVREGGANPETNPKLRFALETARTYNFPKENIENAIKKAVGGGEKEKLEEVIYEAYGPGGVAIIIEGITDNKNRALTEIKQILNQHQGKLVEGGAIRWMFERKGCITVNWKAQNFKNKEELELAAIEAGAEDFYWYNDNLDIYTKVEELEKVKRKLEEKGVIIESAGLDWKPKETVQVSEKEKEACLKLFDALDESDTVQEIYSNLKE